MEMTNHEKETKKTYKRKCMGKITKNGNKLEK